MSISQKYLLWMTDNSYPPEIQATRIERSSGVVSQGTGYDYYSIETTWCNGSIRSRASNWNGGSWRLARKYCSQKQNYTIRCSDRDIWKTIAPFHINTILINNNIEPSSLTHNLSQKSVAQNLKGFEDWVLLPREVKIEGCSSSFTTQHPSIGYFKDSKSHISCSYHRHSHLCCWCTPACLMPARTRKHNTQEPISSLAFWGVYGGSIKLNRRRLDHLNTIWYKQGLIWTHGHSQPVYLAFIVYYWQIIFIVPPSK